MPNGRHNSCPFGIFGKHMIPAFLRWFTFGVVAVAAVGSLYSMPIFILVWISAIAHVIQGDLPPRLGSDLVKAILYLGFFISVIFTGFNAIFPGNPNNTKIWLSLILFYSLSAIACLFPVDVNENLVSGIRSLSLFYLFLILLIFANLFSASKRIAA